MKKLEKLAEIHKNIVDIYDNDELFDLILEQRFAINELVESVNKIMEALKEASKA